MNNFKDFESACMFALNESERERLMGRFEDITRGFSVLDSCNLDGVEPLVSVLDSFNVLREDVSGKVISRDELLINAPGQHDGYFQVPAAID